MKAPPYNLASIAAPMPLFQKAPNPMPPVEAPQVIACPEAGSVPQAKLTAECKKQPGVGGFLGIGEKNVTIPLEKITTSASKAELEAAPAFEQIAQNLQ